MASVQNQVEVSEALVLSGDGRANAYYITSPTLTGGTSLTFSLPPTQGTDGQVLTRSGAGTNTAWSTISSTSASGRPVFSMCFLQSTESGNEYVQFAGNSGVDDVVCRFVYQGSAVTPITNFSCILSSGSSAPTGTINIKNGSTVISSISFSGITSSPTIFSSSSIANLPSSQSILSLVINITGSSSNRVNVYNLSLF